MNNHPLKYWSLCVCVCACPTGYNIGQLLAKCCAGTENVKMMMFLAANFTPDSTMPCSICFFLALRNPFFITAICSDLASSLYFTHFSFTTLAPEKVKHVKYFSSHISNSGHKATRVFISAHTTGTGNSYTSVGATTDNGTNNGRGDGAGVTSNIHLLKELVVTSYHLNSTATTKSNKTTSVTTSSNILLMAIQDPFQVCYCFFLISYFLYILILSKAILLCCLWRAVFLLLLYFRGAVVSAPSCESANSCSNPGLDSRWDI